MKLIKAIAALAAFALGVSSAWAAGTYPAQWDDNCAPSNDVLRIESSTLDYTFALTNGVAVNSATGAYFTVLSGSTATLKASGLPKGVTLMSDTNGWALTGTPSEDKKIYYAVLTASNKNKFEHALVLKFKVGAVEDIVERDDLFMATPVLYVGNVMNYPLGKTENGQYNGTNYTAKFQISGLPKGLKVVKDTYSKEWSTGYRKGTKYELSGFCTTPGRYVVEASQFEEKKFDGKVTFSTNKVSKFEVLVQGVESKYVEVKVGEGKGTVGSVAKVVAADQTFKTSVKPAAGGVFAGWYVDSECTSRLDNGYQDAVLDKDGSYTVANQTWLAGDIYSWTDTLYARFIDKATDTNIVVNTYANYEYNDLSKDSTNFTDVVTFDPNTMADMGIGFYLYTTTTNALARGSYTTVTAVKGLPNCFKAEKGDGFYDEIVYDSTKKVVPGTYEVTLTAKNLSGVTKDVTFTIDIANLVSPAIAVADQSFKLGDKVSITNISLASGYTNYTLKVTGLPAGLKYDSKTKAISGKATKAGEYLVTFTATAKGKDSEVATATYSVTDALVLTPHDYKYDVESLVRTNVLEVTSVSDYKVTFKGLPAGVKYDAKKDVLSGAAKTAGEYEVTATVKNASHTKTADFVLTVPNSTNIVFWANTTQYTNESGNVCSIQAGSTNVYSVAASGYTLSAKGLPAGMKMDKNGKITGTPTAKAGSYDVVITAKKGSTVETYAITLNVVYPTVTVTPIYLDFSAADAKTVTGAGAYAEGKKVTLKAKPSKGDLFDGWYDAGANFITNATTYTFTMADSNETFTAKFATKAQDVITFDESLLPSVMTNKVEGASLYDFYTNAASAYSAKKAMKVSKLPAGFKYTARTMTVSGTAKKHGQYETQITLANASYSTNVVWKMFVPNSDAFTAYAGDKVTNTVAMTHGKAYANEIDLSLATAYSNATISVAGLPAGLKYNAKTGKIEGTPSKAGTYSVTLTAKDGKNVYTSVVTVKVEELPEWLVGTFNGFEYGWEFGSTNGVDVTTNDWFNIAAMTIAKDGKATISIKYPDDESGKSPSKVKIINNVVAKGLALDSIDGGTNYTYVLPKTKDPISGSDFTLNVSVTPEVFGGADKYGVAKWTLVEYDGEDVATNKAYLTQSLYTRKPAVEGLLSVSAKAKKNKIDLSATEKLTFKFGKNGAVTPTYTYSYMDGSKQKTGTGLAAATPVTVDRVTYVMLYNKSTRDETFLEVTLDEDGVFFYQNEDADFQEAYVGTK